MSPFSDLPRGPSRNLGRLNQSLEMVLSALASAFGRTLSSFENTRLSHGEWADFPQVEVHVVLHELQRRREWIIVRFRHYMEQAWRALTVGESMSAGVALSELASSSTRMSSEASIQSRQLARDLVSAATYDCSPLLASLDRRLGLIHEYAMDSAHHPVGPAHVFAAMHHALSICDFSSDMHWTMSTLGMREMRPRLMQAYQSLEHMVEPAGVAIEPMIHWPMSRRSDEGEVPAWIAQLAERLGHNSAVASAFDAVVQDLLLEGLSRFARQSREGGEKRSRTALGASDRQSDIQVDAPSLSKQQILAALSMLQTSSNTMDLESSVSDKDTLAQYLKLEVINQLVQWDMAFKNARFSSADEDVIDLMSLLFQTLLEQHTLEIHARGLIAKLVVPFVRVALLDKRVFVQTTHPARGFLNVLVEVCEGAHAVEDALMIKAEEIVERMLVEFNENPIIFSVLKDELHKFLSQHERYIEIAEHRAVELQRGQESLEAARAVVAAELSKRLDNRQVPQAIEDFLRQPWAHHLTMALLREGEGGAMANDALALADALLDELAQAQRKNVSVPWLQERRHELIKVFHSVGMMGDAVGAAIDALRGTLEAVSMSRPDLERQLPDLPPVAEPGSMAAAAQFPGLDVERGSSTLDLDSSDVEYFRALPIGTWMDFVEKGSEIQVGKLSWVSPVSSRLLFVDRRGERCCVASPEELAGMVRLDRIRPHRHEGAFDRAMQGVIDCLDNAR